MDRLTAEAPGAVVAIPLAPRILNIYCDGGFGNRFNGLVSGLAIAELSGLEPRIIWPVNNWCGAAFETLFDAPFEAGRTEKREFATQIDRYQLLMGWDDMQLGRTFVSPLQLADIDGLRSCLAKTRRDVFYDCVVRPGWISLEVLRRQIHKLPFRSNLRHRADQFCRDHQLEDVFGLHIRKTDFGVDSVDDNGLLDIVERAPDHRFFVCSDDPFVERKFSALPNVVVHHKTAYVERLDRNGEWIKPIVDSSGRVLPFNVRRDAESVVDAIIDLLILTHTRIIRTSHSSFLDVAILLQSCRS